MPAKQEFQMHRCLKYFIPISSVNKGKKGVANFGAGGEGGRTPFRYREGLSSAVFQSIWGNPQVPEHL